MYDMKSVSHKALYSCHTNNCAKQKSIKYNPNMLENTAQICFTTTMLVFLQLFRIISVIFEFTLNSVVRAQCGNIFCHFFISVIFVGLGRCLLLVWKACPIPLQSHHSKFIYICLNKMRHYSHYSTVMNLAGRCLSTELALPQFPTG